MRETKVYLVLEKLSNRERGRCLKFVQSPYFNKNQEIIDLFQLIHKDLNSGRTKAFTKEKVWKKIQANAPYDDVRFRKYLSDLLKLVEQFLAQEQFEKDEYQKSIYELEAVIDKKIDRLYSGMRRFVRKIPENTTYRNSKYYYYLLEASKLLHDLETEVEQKKKISTDFTQLSKALDIYYFAEKLRINYDATIWRRIDGSLNANIKFIDQINEFMQQEAELLDPPVRMYQTINQLSKHPEDDQIYFEYKNQLDENIHFFPPYEAIAIYSAGINHCIRKINTGDSNYLDELYSLYIGYANSTVEYSNELSQWDFNNIITVALRSGKFDQVDQFIKKYGKYIDEKYRDNAVSYNLANLHFYQKKYNKVVEILRNVEYEDMFYNINSKSILIKTYYESDQYDPLIYLLESFRVYLNRNKNIPDSRKTLFKNQIRFTKKLVNLPPKAGAELKKLKEEVTANKNTINRSWLLEKIEELE
jgi:hypothetical protein